MDAKLTWLFVMVLLMVRSSGFALHFSYLKAFSVGTYVLRIFPVTGLHDMDEFVQSQLILAVSATYLFNFTILYKS